MRRDAVEAAALTNTVPLPLEVPYDAGACVLDQDACLQACPSARRTCAAQERSARSHRHEVLSAGRKASATLPSAHATETTYLAKQHLLDQDLVRLRCLTLGEALDEEAE